MKKVTVRHERTGVELARSAVLADRFGLRARGLIGRRFGDGFDGMVFPRCGSIHTCGMGMDIDVLFLDKNGCVTGRREWLGGWRFAGARRAATVVELPAGASEGIGEGDRIAIESGAAAVRSRLRVGDVVFIATPGPLYRRVASASGTWTSHVGFVYQADADACLVAESTIPFSRITTFDNFVGRSDFAQFAVLRLNRDLGQEEQAALRAAADARMRIPYHFWFHYESDWQFCSKFVHQCFYEALDLELSDLVTFRDVFDAHPNMSLAFWRMWYLGRIPWRKRTVAPAAQLKSPHLALVNHDPGIRFVNPPSNADPQAGQGT